MRRTAASAPPSRRRPRCGGTRDSFGSALNIATRSAHMVRPYVAFSMLQPDDRAVGGPSAAPT